ncbi:hypothetical protein DFS34DRAFT_267716 [Phlyctochytrium arcticum]|nr:hypothetical protein DFS34DRAFT_267716 [Phlyctochytrium arcticum]
MVDSTTALSSLPTELLAKIAREIYEDELEAALLAETVSKTLRALSTVSRAWNQVAQSLLYRSIAIRESDGFVCQLQFLLQTLESKPQLASVVRELTFQVRGTRMLTGKDEYYYSQIARIASCCPNLTRLDLGSCRSMGDNELLSIVQNCRPLHELSISACENVTSGGLGKVLPFLTNLRKLDVAGVLKIDDECLRDIVRTCPLLEDLDMWKTSITPTGVLSIVELTAKLAFLNVSPFGELNEAEMETIRIQRPPDFKITSRIHHGIYGDSDSDWSYSSDDNLSDLFENDWTSDDDSVSLD